MSSNRKQQERDQRRRQRRSQRQRARAQSAPAEPIGQVEFTGPMGFMQRHTREFFLGGIIVMVLSLGSIFFATQLGTHDATPDDTTQSPDDSEDIANDPDPEATPDDGIVRIYSAPPEVTIEPDATYEAVIRLEDGDVRIELFADEAPTFVNNFVFLAQNQFYEGLTFHRVIPGLAAQAGDPAGSGFGNPGYGLEADTNSLEFEPGAVAMVVDASGQTNGSQFFITTAPTPHLDGEFTVFGRVVEGLELVQGLTPRDPEERPESDGDMILGIDIIELEA